MSLIIYHNPRCSKSRQTLALIEEAGKSAEIRLYLKNHLQHAELTDLLGQLGFDDPRQLIRTQEAIYKDLGLKNIEDEDEVIAAMLAHPKLIERPIVSNGQKAVLGRPPEAVKALL